jgi:sugar lactone lactonase YvrE
MNKSKQLFKIAGFFLMLAMIISCGKKTPDKITVKKTNLFPEGIAYDALGKRFIISSLREGVLSQVTDDGTIKPFITNDKFISAIGLRINPAGNKLYACNSNPGVSIHKDKKPVAGVAELGIFSLPDGKELAFLDLGELDKEAKHFCNDIAFAKDGNAYITDSFGGILYKVDTANKKSIILKDEKLLTQGFGLNGLVYHSDGYLILAHSDSGVLFKVPLHEPAKYHAIKISEKLVGADGLAWLANGNLSVISNGATNTIFELQSKDWESANIISKVATGPVFATTGARRGTEYFFLQAKLDKLFSGQLPVETFEIIKYKSK